MYEKISPHLKLLALSCQIVPRAAYLTKNTKVIRLFSELLSTKVPATKLTSLKNRIHLQYSQIAATTLCLCLVGLFGRVTT